MGDVGKAFDGQLVGVTLVNDGQGFHEGLIFVGLGVLDGTFVFGIDSTEQGDEDEGHAASDQTVGGVICAVVGSHFVEDARRFLKLLIGELQV